MPSQRRLPRLASRFLALLLAPVLALPLIWSTPASSQTQAAPELATGFTPKPLVESESAMIVAAHPLASAAGAEILEDGGAAVDAAIAAQLVLNVVEPQSSGIGGGAFALTYSAANAQLVSWDGRETAPAAAREDMFLGPDGVPLGFLDAVASGLSVGVPTLIRMMEAMHERHGVLPWARLFEPAIRHASDGFTVTPRLAASITRYEERLRTDRAAARLFFDENGMPLRAGATMANPALAETLRAVAAEGAEAFYTGSVAEAIVAAVAAGPRGGAMTLDDLAGAAAVSRPAVCALYRVYFQVCGMGPPSSGATTVGQMLKLLDHFPLGDFGPDDPAAWHLFAEASKLAYADRAAYLADPDFVSVPTQGLLDALYMTIRAQKIDRARTSDGPAAPGNPPWREGQRQAPDPTLGAPGTTHLSVVDADGNIVSMTSSIEIAFGSGRMAAGFLLNNQLTDFSFVPVRDGLPVANRVAAGKRPRSSMAPTIVFDVGFDGTRRPAMVLGSPGGSRIPEYVAQAVIGLVDWKLPPNEAAALPHVSQRNRNQTVVEKQGLGDGIAAGLSAMGHTVTRADMTSGLHIIVLDPERGLLGGADPRREGMAQGF